MIPMAMAEDYAWWAGVQPRAGFEEQIDLILPRADSWSTSVRLWADTNGNDAHICYMDESKSKVEEIAFRVDARQISQDLILRICTFAKGMGSVLMTPEYEILVPDKITVLAAVTRSVAKKFVDDPASTLQKLDQSNIQERVNYLTHNHKKQ